MRLGVNRLLSRIKAFILKDVSNETETKELAVLLRLLCVFYVLFYVISSILIANLYLYTISVILLAFIVLLCYAFILTYDNKTVRALYIFHFTILFSSVLLTLFCGWNANFQWGILVSLMVSFFNVNSSMNTKQRFSKIMVSLLVCLSIFSHLAINEPEIKHNINFFLQTINAFFYGLIFCYIAYLFCTKYSQAETKLRKINKSLAQTASQDSLTRLPNRRSMNEHLAALAYEYERSGKPFCIAIADVDFFKRINDSYGHDTGDYVLTTLSELFRSTMKGRGVAARWGGEEFLFCFEGINGRQAYIILESLRMQIEKKKFMYKDHILNITVTFGLEEYSQIIGTEATISKADVKLYEGKASGRNKVVF